jgi:hypothetical protein
MSQLEDSSGLTDADWAEINRLKRVYESGGADALDTAFSNLTEIDPIRATVVLEAFLNPETWR